MHSRTMFLTFLLPCLASIEIAFSQASPPSAFRPLLFAAEGAKKIPNGVLAELKRLHFDTAQSSNPYALSSLTRLVSMSQILFGTDFPYRTTAEHVKGLADCGLFTATDLDAIGRGNAARLLPRYS